MTTPNSVQYKFAFIEHDKTNGHKNDITPLASQFCIISKKKKTTTKKPYNVTMMI